MANTKETKQQEPVEMQEPEEEKATFPEGTIVSKKYAVRYKGIPTTGADGKPTTDEERVTYEAMPVYRQREATLILDYSGQVIETVILESAMGADIVKIQGVRRTIGSPEEFHAVYDNLDEGKDPMTYAELYMKRDKRPATAATLSVKAEVITEPDELQRLIDNLEAQRDRLLETEENQ